jgi:hypothetical protein
VRLEAVLPAGHGLVRVPRLGVDDADHPVRSDLLGDPPTRRTTRIVGVVRVNELDVLPGDQREQPDGVRRRPGLLRRQRREHRQRVADEGVDQGVPGRLVVPGDPWLARIVVVMRRRHLRDDLRGAGDLAADPSDCGDQLCDRVLRRDRRRPARSSPAPAGLALEAPVCAITVCTAVKIRFGSPLAARPPRQ